MSLTDREIVRYSRHIILPEVGGRGQRKLKAASVLICGVGATGSAAALYLAAAGIGRLTVWDPAVLTPADLEGGIAHSSQRLGQPRSRSAAPALSAINPDATVEVLDRESDVVGAVPDHQIVLASAGNWAELLASAYRSGAAAVLTSARGATGAAAAFRSGEPCLNCLGGQRAAALGLFPEEGAPALAAAAGVVGVVGATEAVKLILGTGQPLFGRVLSYDGWTASFREDSFQRLQGCPVCG